MTTTTTDLILTREQALTIQYEIQMAKEHWPEIEKWYPGQTFEEGVERFCEAAISGNINGWCYFGDNCGCFYGHLTPQIGLDPHLRRNKEMTDRAIRIAESIFVKMYGEHALNDAIHEVTSTKTYIEGLLASKSLGISEGITIFTEQGIRPNAYQFLRELYCLCYPFCSEEWRIKNPHMEVFTPIANALSELTEGAEPAALCSH